MDLKKTIINKFQEQINKLYEEEGATEEIIDLQVSVNQLRHKYDIVDDNEKIYADFVQ